MAFLVDPKRRHTFKYDEDGVSFSVTFEFVCSEDLDLSEIRRRLSDFDVDKKDDSKAQDRSTNFMLYNLRTALIECEDILHHETNEPLKIRNDDGSINVENQKGIFEAVKNLMCKKTVIGDDGQPEKDADGKDKIIEESFLNRIITAYVGASSKNLKPGATQS